MGKVSIWTAQVRITDTRTVIYVGVSVNLFGHIVSDDQTELTLGRVGGKGACSHKQANSLLNLTSASLSYSFFGRVFQ